MPQPMMDKFESGVTLGARYRDEQTGVEGVATSITFFQHSCERVVLEFFNNQEELKELVFDSPRLIRIDVVPEEKVESKRTGGGPVISRQRNTGRR